MQDVVSRTQTFILRGLERLLGGGDIWSRPWRRAKMVVVGPSTQRERWDPIRDTQCVWHFGNRTEPVWLHRGGICTRMRGVVEPNSNGGVSSPKRTGPSLVSSRQPWEAFVGGKHYNQIGDLGHGLDLQTSYLKWGPCASSIGAAWELARNAGSLDLD